MIYANKNTSLSRVALKYAFNEKSYASSSVYKVCIARTFLRLNRTHLIMKDKKNSLTYEPK